MKRIAVLVATLALVLVVVSANSHHWRAGSTLAVEVTVGLLSLDVCMGPLTALVGDSACTTMSVAEITPGTLPAFKRVYLIASQTTYGVSVAAALLLVAVLFLSLTGSTLKLNRYAMFACTAYGVLSAMTVATWSGEPIPIAWSFWLAIAGAALGAFGAGLLSAPVETEVNDGQMSAALAERLRAMEQERASKPTPPVARPIAKDAIRNPMDLEARSTAADQASTMLRFVVKEATFDGHGVTVLQDGGTRRIGWDELGGVVVRALPIEPPFEGRVMVDLVPKGTDSGRPSPARFLATTRANYADLGGAPSSTSLDSLRRVCEYALARNRSLVRDPDLSAFIAGSAPRRFQAIKEFRVYDSGF